MAISLFPKRPKTKDLRGPAFPERNLSLEDVQASVSGKTTKPDVGQSMGANTFQQGAELMGGRKPLGPEKPMFVADVHDVGELEKSGEEAQKDMIIDPTEVFDQHRRRLEEEAEKWGVVTPQMSDYVKQINREKEEKFISEREKRGDFFASDMTVGFAPRTFFIPPDVTPEALSIAIVEERLDEINRKYLSKLPEGTPVGMLGKRLDPEATGRRLLSAIPFMPDILKRVEDPKERVIQESIERVTPRPIAFKAATVILDVARIVGEFKLVTAALKLPIGPLATTARGRAMIDLSKEYMKNHPYTSGLIGSEIVFNAHEASGQIARGKLEPEGFAMATAEALIFHSGYEFVYKPVDRGVQKFFTVRQNIESRSITASRGEISDVFANRGPTANPKRFNEISKAVYQNSDDIGRKLMKGRGKPIKLHYTVEVPGGGTSPAGALLKKARKGLKQFTEQVFVPSGKSNVSQIRVSGGKKARTMRYILTNGEQVKVVSNGKKLSVYATPGIDKPSLEGFYKSISTEFNVGGSDIRALPPERNVEYVPESAELKFVVDVSIDPIVSEFRKDLESKTELQEKAALEPSDAKKRSSEFLARSREVQNIEKELQEAEAKLDLQRATFTGLSTGPTGESIDLQPLTNKRTGELAEVSGERGGPIFAQQGDDISKSLGFESSEDLRSLQPEIQKNREILKGMEQDVAEIKGRLREAKKIRNQAKTAIKDAQRSVPATEKKAKKDLIPKGPSRAELKADLIEAESLPPSEARDAAVAQIKEAIAASGTPLEVARRGETAAHKKMRNLQKSNKALTKELHNLTNRQTAKKLDKTIRTAKLPEKVRKELEPLRKSLAKPGSKIRGITELANLISRQPENHVSHQVLDFVRSLNGKRMSSLTAKDLALIDDLLSSFVKSEHLANKIIIRGEKKNIDDVVKEALANVNLRHESKNNALTGLDSMQKESDGTRVGNLATIESYNMELKAEILDGKLSGIIKDVMYNEVNAGVDKQFRFEHQAEDFFKDKLEGIDISGWSHSFNKKAKNVHKVTIKISGNRTLSMSKGERVALFLHTLNEDNLRHLVEGGISFERTPSKIIELNNNDILVIQGILTDDEMTVAAAINEYFNAVQKPALNAESRPLMGHDVAREPDYFKIRTNFLDKFNSDILRQNIINQTLEGQGMFEERVQADNAIILEDVFTATYKSIKRSGAFIGLASPVRNMRLLLQNDEFLIGMRNAGKNAYVKDMKEYVDRIEGDPIKFDNISSLTIEAINKLDVGILGLNPFVMANQPISLLAAGTEMSMADLSKGIAEKDVDIEKYTIQVGKTRAKMHKWSPQIRDRLDGNVSREMGEVAHVGAPMRFWTGKTVVSQKFMAGVTKFDTEAIGGIWEGIEIETKRLHPDLKGDDFYRHVAERHWEVVRKTQPTFHIKDRSTIGMRRGTLTRLLTKYSSQRNKNYIILRRSGEKYNRSGKTAKDKAIFAKTIAIVTLLTPMMLMANRELRGKLYGRKEKRTMFGRALDIIEVNLGNIYVLGAAVASLRSKVEKGPFAGYEINTTLLGVVNELISDIATLIRAGIQKSTGETYQKGEHKNEEKWKVSAKKGLIETTEDIAKIRGIPLHSIRKLTESGFKKIQEGNISEERKDLLKRKKALEEKNSDKKKLLLKKRKKLLKEQKARKKALLKERQ